MKKNAIPKTNNNEEEKAATALLIELQKGEKSGIIKGYHTSEEIREFINQKGR